MELYTKVDCSSCPQCGENAYLVCSNLEFIEVVKFNFCTNCGYPDISYEPVKPEKDAPQDNDTPTAFSGLCCLKLRNGGTKFYSISGDTNEIVSWFTRVLREPDIDPNGSYLNNWDRKTLAILTIGVDQATLPSFDGVK